MSKRAEELVRKFGTTYAEQANITLTDKPSPLWCLLVLSLLLSARIDAEIACRSARELFRARWRTPQRMRDSTWQQRVDALGRGGYRRYDERTATQLGEAAELVLDRWKGDLRRLHRESDSAQDLAVGLQTVKGIGPAGAAIFLREVQVVWTDIRPFADIQATEGADRLGLSQHARQLARQVPAEDFHRLVALCVRANHDDDLAREMNTVG